MDTKTNPVDQHIEWLKSRYARDNAVIDLIALLEKLRDENHALHGIIKTQK
jgi:hypothetical protein